MRKQLRPAPFPCQSSLPFSLCQGVLPPGDGWGRWPRYRGSGGRLDVYLRSSVAQNGSYVREPPCFPSPPPASLGGGRGGRGGGEGATGAEQRRRRAEESCPRPLLHASSRKRRLVRARSCKGSISWPLSGRRRQQSTARRSCGGSERASESRAHLQTQPGRRDGDNPEGGRGDPGSPPAVLEAACALGGVAVQEDGKAARPPPGRRFRRCSKGRRGRGGERSRRGKVKRGIWGGGEGRSSSLPEPVSYLEVGRGGGG